MKIGSKTAVNSGGKKSRGSAKISGKGGSLFASIFGVTEAGTVKEDLREAGVPVEELLEELSVLGRDLSFHRSPGALERYKKKVRQILQLFIDDSQQTVNQLTETADGHHKQICLIKTIDENLAELTRIALDQEKSNIDLAAQIDNIRGILIDCLK